MSFDTNLAPGYLYAAPGYVSRSRVRRSENYVGPTRGGVKLSYTRKAEAVADRAGNTVGEIAYGGRVKMSGKLAHVTPEAVCRLLGDLGGEVDPNGDVRAARFPGADVARVTVCLVCPSDGGETEFYAVCSAADELSFALGSCDGDGVAFSLTAFCTRSAPRLSFIRRGAAL